MATAPCARGKLQPAARALMTIAVTDVANSRTGYEPKDQFYGSKNVISWNPQKFDEERLRFLSTSGGNLTEAR